MINNIKRIKILYIITELAVGGAQDNILLTIKGLDKLKYDISLLSATGGAWEKRAKSIPGIKIYLTTFLKRNINPIYDLLAFIKILILLIKNRYHIVHTHSSKSGFLGRLAARCTGIPVIIHTIHGFPFNDFMHCYKRAFYILLEKLADKFTDRLITVSNLNKEKAIALNLSKPYKFINIYNGIDFNKFDYNNIALYVYKKRKELSILKHYKIVGTVGRLSPQKAPQYIIEAASLILSKNPNIIFLFVGDGELRYNLEKLADKLNIKNNILFLGTREDVHEIISIFDVFVLSSLWEGLPRALIEAMALGKPVVVTDVEGVPEIVEDNSTGFLVPPKNPFILAENITKCLIDENLAKRLGQNARERVLNDFSIDKMLMKINTLYDVLIAEKVKIK